MSAPETDGPRRFGLLASHIAGRIVDVAAAPAGRLSHTDGRVIFVAADLPAEQQRREVVLQGALLAAGSLDREIVRSLRTRPPLARRYLAVEGYRALAEAAARLPVAAALQGGVDLESSSSADSLAIAKSRTMLPEPPSWFGQIAPALLLRVDATAAATAAKDVRATFDPGGDSEADGEDDAADGPGERSKILKLFEAPGFSSRALAEFIRKLLGSSRSYGDDSAGAEVDLGSILRGRGTGAGACPAPTPVRFTGDANPEVSYVGGALFPEWDVHSRRYRPEWSRVIDFSPTVAAGARALDVVPDDVLRRRLARVGLGFKALRARPDGDELDIESVIDLFVDMRCGHSPAGDVYIARRKCTRDLGVLILLDASGSATDTDGAGLTVHDHQRQAAGILAATLEELGDRVALYGFRSNGRHAVHLPAIKTFEQRFGAGERARLAQLQPSGYTRLGAGIRGAGEILKTRAGTPHRLLVVLSDGYAYDHGYEGDYAEADVVKALEELRAAGVGSLCLAVGAEADAGALARVFGPASQACAPTLTELSPRMDELFLSALRAATDI